MVDILRTPAANDLDDLTGAAVLLDQTPPFDLTTEGAFRYRVLGEAVEITTAAAITDLLPPLASQPAAQTTSFLTTTTFADVALTAGDYLVSIAAVQPSNNSANALTLAVSGATVTKIGQTQSGDGDDKALAGIWKVTVASSGDYDLVLTSTNGIKSAARIFGGGTLTVGTPQSARASNLTSISGSLTPPAGGAMLAVASSDGAIGGLTFTAGVTDVAGAAVDLQTNEWGEWGVAEDCAASATTITCTRASHGHLTFIAVAVEAA